MTFLRENEKPGKTASEQAVYNLAQSPIAMKRQIKHVNAVKSTAAA